VAFYHNGEKLGSNEELLLKGLNSAKAETLPYLDLLEAGKRSWILNNKTI
jgi:hypothetical protein